VARLDRSVRDLSSDTFDLMQRKPDIVLKAPRWAEKTLGREQVHLLVGGVGIRIDSEERWALRLLLNILGGQSGRLFIELREKKSLAYTVAPASFEGMEAGYMGTYIATSPSKRKEALEGIQKVLQDFAKKGPTDSEMKRARQYYLGRRAMDLQSESSVATQLGLEAVYSLPRLNEEEIAKRISRVSAKSVRELCEKYWVQAPQVTVSVG
jgi:zinc protease